MRCEEVREQLPAYVDGGRNDLAVRRHLATCRACEAELARYRSLLEGLESLQGKVVETPPDLVRSLAAIPATQSRLNEMKGHFQRNRTAYLGGLALAAAGAAAWRARARRLAVA